MTIWKRFFVTTALVFGMMGTVDTAPAQTLPGGVITNVVYDPTRKRHRALSEAFTRDRRASNHQKVIVASSLCTPAAQKLIARDFYRLPRAGAAEPGKFPQIKMMVTVGQAIGGSTTAQAGHFAEGALLAQIDRPGNQATR